MSTIVSCSGCERKLRVPDDLLGRQVVCPSCNLQFTAEAVGGGASANGDTDRDEKVAAERSARRRDEDEDDRPARRSRRDEDDDRRGRRRDEDEDHDDRRSRRRDEEDDYDDRRPRRRRDEDDYDDRPRKQADPKEGWKKVGLGLTMIKVGNWVAVGTLGVLAVAYLLLVCQVGETMLTVLATFKVIAEVAEVVFLGLGTGFCLVVPAPARGKSSLKPLALTAFILACVQALFLLVSAIVDMNSYIPFAISVIMPVGAGTGSTIVHILASLVTLAAIILLLIFLRTVVDSIRERSIDGDLQRVMMGFIGAYAFGGAVILTMWIVGRSVSMSSYRTWHIIGAIFAFLVITMAIGVRVWFFAVLVKVQQAINRHRRRL